MCGLVSPDTTLPTISLDGVSVQVDGRPVLSDVSVDLSARHIAVIGANGSGKSTFARLLNGLVRPAAGSVVVHGLDSTTDRAELRRRVGFVFTNPDAQILMPTPAEDLALSVRGKDRVEIERLVERTLERFELAGHADVPASSLSGGQKQLLALASVLITRPQLIVADEPTTLLDLRNARRIGDLLLSQSAQLVLVTHDLRLAERCDTVLLFEDGRLIDVGEPCEIVDSYRRACG